jgi:hypothetical protein
VSKNEKFEDVLNLCFDRILKGQSVEQCLADYPEQARELEPLLRTFAAARLASQVTPRAEFKAQGKYQFQVAVAEMSRKEKKPAATGWHWRWQSAWSIAIMAFLVVIVAGGGTVAAASRSMPDSPLYSLKLATEQVRLTLTPTELGKAEYNAELASQRVAEISYLAGKASGQEVQAVAMRLNTNFQNIEKLAGGESNATSTGASPSNALSAPAKGAGPALDNSQAAGGVNTAPATLVPAPVLPPTMAAMATPAPTVTTTATAITATAAPTTSAPGVVASAANPAAAPASRGENSYGLDQSNTPPAFPPLANYGPENEKAKIAALMGQQALADIEKLNAILATASPEVRPAIRQAIAQAQVEFDKANQLYLAARNAVP